LTKCNHLTHVAGRDAAVKRSQPIAHDAATNNVLRPTTRNDTRKQQIRCCSLVA
jgi:hypothetical protein